MEPNLKLLNSLSGNIEEVTPVNKPLFLGLYTCGITANNYTHIGHMRTYVFEDILKRTLQHNGFLVEHVMNVTDVGHLTSDSDTGEDKIEKQAKQEKKSAYQISSFYTRDFLWNLKKLNIIYPGVLASAAGHVKEQIELIKQLDSKGYTYKTSDGVYFDTSKIEDYNNLFNQNKGELKASERIENSNEKKNPGDFALWKFSPKNEKRQMEWKSPWGIGFPGWHSECVAMAMKYLGPYFDIHCGGVDHLPVHHPNEIAQAEAITGKHLSKYWMHVGFLLMNNVKMSKSIGNVIRIKDLMNEGFNPLAYRYFVLNTNYHKTTDFNDEVIKASQNALNNLYNFILKIKTFNFLNLTFRFKVKETNESKNILETTHKDFFNALNDDLNTPKALETVWNFITEVNKNPNSFKPSKVLKMFKDFDFVLGFKLFSFKYSAIPVKVKILGVIYFVFKKLKKFQISDKFRKQINTIGYQIEDNKKYYIISRIKN